MKQLYFIVFLILLTSCAKAPKSELLGVWKSNEELTIESMNSIVGVTQKAKDIFENDFFGHLIAEYKETEARAYFDNCEEECEKTNNCGSVCDDFKKFTPYELIEETDSYFIIQNYDELLSEDVEKTLYREDQCYYMLFSKWKIKEYFCRE